MIRIGHKSGMAITMLRCAFAALVLVAVALTGGADAGPPSGRIDGAIARMAHDALDTRDGRETLQLAQSRRGGGFSAPRITPSFNNSARGMAPRAPQRSWGATGGTSGSGITNQVRRWTAAPRTAPGQAPGAAPGAAPATRWGAAPGWKAPPPALAPRFSASTAPAPALQAPPAVRRAFAGAAAAPQARAPGSLKTAFAGAARPAGSQAGSLASARTAPATPLSRAFAGAVTGKAAAKPATGSAMVRASAPKPVPAPKGPVRAMVDRAAHAARLAAERVATRPTVAAARPRFDAARDRLRGVFAAAARPTLGQTFRTAAAAPGRKTDGAGGPSSGSPAPKRLTPVFNAAAAGNLAARAKAVGESLRAAKVGRLDSRVRGHPVVARGAQAFDLVDPRYRQEVRESFQGPVVAYRLSRPMVVYRIHGDSGRQGNYFSRFSYKDVLRAARRLALPSANDLSRKTAYILPAGTVVLVGKVAPQVGTPGFPDTATGGGEQIVATDRNRPFALDFAAERLREL